MFNKIPKKITDRMAYLENMDKERKNDRSLGPGLLQVSSDAGKLLSILSAAAPKGDIIEIGTSGGYSTLWLCLSAIENNTKVTTYEIDEDKFRLASETFDSAGVSGQVNQIKGDARKLLGDLNSVSFCFLDAAKEVYEECYDLVVPKLVSGGMLVADNVLSHWDYLHTVVEKAEKDERVDSVVVPLGTGMLICRKV